MIGLGLLVVIRSQAQDYDSLLQYYLKSDSIMLDELALELSAGDMNIDDLIAGLMGQKVRYSMLTTRLGYTSSITYAGRDFGIDQQGLGIGATYYHHTGIFADLSGYWNSDTNPRYNPTIASLGYMGVLTPKWTYTFGYDRYFYQKPDSSELDVYYPFSNSINATSYVELGKFTLTSDYSFLFGEEQSHRLRAGLMYSITGRKIGFIDRLVFIPGISMLLGNSDIYKVSPIYPEMNLRTKYDLHRLMVQDYGRAHISYLWRKDRPKYRELEQLTYEQYKDELVNYIVEDENAFGIMNYSFSAPLYLYVNQFTLGLTYHYNIPVELPGEDLDSAPNSYVGATLMYSMPFKKHK